MRLTVLYEGERVGILDDTQGTYFQYDPVFATKEIELSPIRLRLRDYVGAQTQALRTPFEGRIPGLCDDSLPDWWGMQNMNQRLILEGVNPHEVTALRRLSMIGDCGMGAITYEPAEETKQVSEDLTIREAIVHASQILRNDTSAVLPNTEVLLGAGSPAGGRQPKYLIWFNAQGNYIINASEAPAGYVGWILKLDMKGENQEPDLCFNEHLYSIVAEEAGLRVAKTVLMPMQDGHKHLKVKRFDRDGAKRIHMHSYGGMSYSTQRYAGSYDEFIAITREITKDMREVKEAYRRMVFNYYAGNRDDHSKNVSFLMDAAGEWTVSPAYDLTPTPRLGTHMMSINGKWEITGTSAIEERDMLALADRNDINGQEIIDQVKDVMRKYDITLATEN